MKPTNLPLLRYNQRQLLQEEKAKAQRLFKDPMNDDRAAQARTIRTVDKMLKEQGPEPLTGPERDKLYRREKELAEDIRGFMVPREEMRRTPTQQTNAVYNHLKQEGNPDSKRKILEWKNIRVQLNQDSDDPNLANADFHLRPSRGTSYSGLMVDGMGPRGHMGFQDVPQENWDMALGQPTADTALKQAQRVHDEQGGKKGMSAEARAAASERMKAKWEAKRAKGSKAAAHDEVSV